jgi:predicted ATPase/DNA-binding winged helix-turn-helix (wHTH) protein
MHGGTGLDLNDSADTAITFGPFQIFLAQRCLMRDGQPVRLGSRAFDLLLALVESAGTLISKEDLIARVWPGTHVEEVVLRVHVTALRKVLSDGRPDARDVLTVPGRGYQFVTPTASQLVPKPKEVGSNTRQNATDVPELQTRVIGRDDDVANIIARLQTNRCITISGTAGIGKTTVALAVAQILAPRFVFGATFVDLAPVSAAAHVIDAIARAIGFTGGGSISTESIAAFLEGRELLLIVDNCEHILDEVAPVIAALIRRPGPARIMTTSREPLRLRGESVYRLLALRTPVQVDCISAQEALQYPAVELFVERAAASAGRFILDDTAAPIVAAICCQLDGISLAIELAAMRMDTFGVADIANMLEHRFRLFRQSQHESTPRHRSLLAALDWSYGMLRTDQRAVLHRLSSFSSRFTVEDAVQVAADASLSPADVLECLADLVEKSFVLAVVDRSVACYGLYETMREYARQKAADASELEDVKWRHARYMTYLFEKADRECELRPPSEWLLHHGRYLDDVRSAIDWSMGLTGEKEFGISITASAVTLWTLMSLFAELRERVELSLQMLGDRAAQGGAREMKLFAALSNALANLVGATEEGEAACRLALAIAERIGDDGYQAKALFALWNGCFADGQVRLSLTLAEDFMSVATRLGQADVLVGHRMLGASNFYLGNVDVARRNMEIMVGSYSETSHGGHMARFAFGQLPSGRGLLASYLCFQGHLERAMEQTRQSVVEALQSRHGMTVCGVLATTSIQNSIYTGHLDEAEGYVDVLLRHSIDHRFQRWEKFAHGYAGVLAIKRGQREEGLRKLTTSFSPLDDLSNTRYMLMFCEHALAIGASGDPCGGLRAIDKIRERLEETGNRWYLPEVHRCRALLLHMNQMPASDVEAAFMRSHSLAVALGAVTWQLRVAMDFSAFLCDQRRLREAIELLRRTYGLFTEGHGCPAVLAAQTRLQELMRTPDPSPISRQGCSTLLY